MNPIQLTPRSVVMTEEEAEARALTDTNPNAFGCPDCGKRMAVFHTHGVDIFHETPECSRFLARDATYRVRVLECDLVRRKTNEPISSRFIPDA
jgi:hypothetical protein